MEAATVVGPGEVCEDLGLEFDGEGEEWHC